MWYEPIFKNRRDAGIVLAKLLKNLSGRDDVVVLALPRGGVPVGFEISRALNVPLDVFVVRKLGVPAHEELAFGAIASGGAAVFNEDVIRSCRISTPNLKNVLDREQIELKRRERLFRSGRPPINVRDKTVIVADDGLATGATMAAAVGALKKMHARRIYVAVPVASTRSYEEFNSMGENVRCIAAATPEPFYGVGMWYEDFSQTTDNEVQELLFAAAMDNIDSIAPTI